MKKTKTDLDQILALFEQRRYEEVVTLGHAATKTSTEVEDGLRSQVRELIRASHVLQNIKVTQDGVTSKLQSGWYSERIRQLIAEKRLKRLLSVSVPMDDALPKDRNDVVPMSGCENIFKSGCAVVMCIGGIDDKDWSGIGPQEQRDIPTSTLRGSYLDRWSDGRVFLKDSISTFSCDDGCLGENGTACVYCQTFPLPMYQFPVWCVEPTASVAAAESPVLDLQFGVDLVSDATHAALQSELDALGELRKDSPAPKYHNIIDLNVGVVNDVWVPTEFDVPERPQAETVAVSERPCQKPTQGSNLPQNFVATAMKTETSAFASAEIRSPIPDLDPHDHSKLYVAVQDVMEAALPLLARMRNPALLLPGPLQAAVKAQRIVLKEGETYRGVWHEDGMKESVVAVVLYYYRASPTLRGGDIEIASKIRSPVCMGDQSDFTEENTRAIVNAIPRSKVPVSEGTLLVFGNYAAVHRVLPMQAVGGPGSRDFLAFFIIDQRAPLRMHRDLGPLTARKQRRAELLQKQLEPRGSFGWDGSQIYSFGNGDYTDIAWLRAGGEKASAGDWFEEDDDFFKISALMTQMNISPPVLGRGIHFLLCIQALELTTRRTANGYSILLEGTASDTVCL